MATLRFVHSAFDADGEGARAGMAGGGSDPLDRIECEPAAVGKSLCLTHFKRIEPMNLIEAMLAEFDQEAATTRRLLEAVPESKYDWRPHEKGMSMEELCGHMAGMLNNMPTLLDGDSFDISQRPAPSAPPADRASLLALFDAGVSRSKEWLGSLGDKLDDTWRLYRGEEEMMAMPRAMAIRGFLFNHLYHHRGQLSAYLRFAGEPVPPVYGPTADFDPFAA